MGKLKQIAPGYFVDERSEKERRASSTLTAEQVKELLAPIKSRAIADEIARRYEQATRAQRGK